MSERLIESAVVILAVCILVRLADLVLEPVLPTIVVAAFLAGVAWLMIGRPRGLS